MVAWAVFLTITYCKEDNEFHCNKKAPTHDIFTTETIERLLISRENREQRILRSKKA